MARPLKSRPYKVHIADHAWERFQQRAGPYNKLSHKKLCQILHAKINNVLGPGMRFAYFKAARVEIFPFLCAVVTVGDDRLDVITFKYGIDEKEGATG